MKKIDIKAAVNAFGRIPVNKVKDDKVRFALLNDYRKLRKAFREIAQEESDIIDKFQADFKEEIISIVELRKTNHPISGHDDFLLAEAEANKAVRDLLSESVEVEGLVTVSAEDFMKAVRDGDYTFEDLGALDGIVIE